MKCIHTSQIVVIALGLIGVLSIIVLGKDCMAVVLPIITALSVAWQPYQSKDATVSPAKECQSG